MFRLVYLNSNWKDIIATVIGGIPTDLSFDEAQAAISDKRTVHKGTTATFARFRTNVTSPSKDDGIIRRIYEDKQIVLPATGGERTLAKATDVFTGFLDKDFKKWGTDKQDDSTKEAAVAVYEMAKNATFAQMFGSLGNPDALVLSQEQIIAFCEKHRDKLRQEGWATFFLFRANRQLLVAYVRVDERELKAYVDRFDHSLVWRADYRYRMVVLQR